MNHTIRLLCNLWRNLRDLSVPGDRSDFENIGLKWILGQNYNSQLSFQIGQLLCKRVHSNIRLICAGTCWDMPVCDGTCWYVRTSTWQHVPAADNSFNFILNCIRTNWILVKSMGWNHVNSQNLLHRSGLRVLLVILQWSIVENI